MTSSDNNATPPRPIDETALILSLLKQFSAADRIPSSVTAAAPPPHEPMHARMKAYFAGVNWEGLRAAAPRTRSPRVLPLSDPSAMLRTESTKSFFGQVNWEAVAPPQPASPPPPAPLPSPIAKPGSTPTASAAPARVNTARDIFSDFGA